MILIFFPHFVRNTEREGEMKKFLNQVKVVEEKHTYLDINCFEKPICILLDNIGTGYSDVFFLYLKIIECYDIKTFQCLVTSLLR